jgi:hypothetical protein
MNRWSLPLACFVAFGLDGWAVIRSGGELGECGVRPRSAWHPQVEVRGVKRETLDYQR